MCVCFFVCVMLLLLFKYLCIDISHIDTNSEY